MEIKIKKIADLFRHEVNKVKRLKHRNIIKIYDIFLNEAPFFIITDYIGGVSIKKIVESIGYLPFFLTLDVMIELSEVLDYLRYRKIFHIGIRPSKVILDEENIPMISPFEVIKVGSNDRGLIKFQEDCRYLSPELLETGADYEKEPDTLEEAEKNDQFSLGLIAYEMLTGKPLFEGGCIYEIIMSREKFFHSKEERDKKWKVLKEVNCPPSFINIIKKLLEEKPQNRFNYIWELDKLFRKFKPTLDPKYQILLESYNRCLATRPDFVEAFYDALFKALPHVKNLFNKDNWDHHKKMFQSAQRAFLEGGGGIRYIERLPQIKAHKNVTIEEYQIFMNTFLEIVADSDPRWKSSDVQQSWKETTNNSLAFLKKIL